MADYILHPPRTPGDMLRPLDVRMNRLERPPSPVVTDVSAAGLFRNGWVNYGAGYATAGYYDNAFETVLQGIVKSGPVGSTIFVLPITAAPWDGASHRFVCDNSGGNQATVVVMGNGTVQHIFGANAFVSLDGIRFLHG